MTLTFSSLRDKEVINVCDGKRMGYVCDLEMDSECGRICTLILPPKSFLSSFKKGACIHIPFSCIRQIGRDLILVEMGLPRSCN